LAFRMETWVSSKDKSDWNCFSSSVSFWMNMVGSFLSVFGVWSILCCGGWIYDSFSTL
jgi:hypothetical protein